NITLGQLPAIERDPGSLVHLALEQLGRAGDATAVAAAIGQRDPCRLERGEQRLGAIHPVGCARAVGEGYRDGPLSHSQISEVQSRPGWRVAGRGAARLGSWRRSTKKPLPISRPPASVLQLTITMQPPFSRISG